MPLLVKLIKVALYLFGICTIQVKPGICFLHIFSYGIPGFRFYLLSCHYKPVDSL